MSKKSGVNRVEVLSVSWCRAPEEVLFIVTSEERVIRPRAPGSIIVSSLLSSSQICMLSSSSQALYVAAGIAAMLLLFFLASMLYILLGWRRGKSGISSCCVLLLWPLALLTSILRKPEDEAPSELFQRWSLSRGVGGYLVFFSAGCACGRIQVLVFARWGKSCYCVFV